MDVQTIKSRIEEWLNPLLKERNFFLVEIKISMGKKVEVYVDSDEGIHIDDCALISRFLEKHLDGSGLVPDNYILEVSSPGMNNPLRVPRQYKKRIGKKLEIIKTNGEKIEAQLIEADEEKIKLIETIEEKKNKKNKGTAPEPKHYELKYADIKRATVIFSF
jgi:ribosome maturation factor RimP